MPVIMYNLLKIYPLMSGELCLPEPVEYAVHSPSAKENRQRARHGRDNRQCGQTRQYAPWARQPPV